MSLYRDLLVVICGVLIASRAVSGKDEMRAVGDQVSFKLDEIGSSLTSITWKHIKTGQLTVKAIEWEDGEITTPNQRFKDITTLNTTTGQITITKLRVEHTGVYTIDVSGKEQTQRFSLTVMERVPKPVIEVEKINPDVVYLSCKNYNGTITWSNSAGEPLAYQSNSASITVKKIGGNLESFYTCTLENAVSQETSNPVYKKDLFNDESTSGPWWIVFIVIPVILIIGSVPLYKFNESFKNLVDDKCPCMKDTKGKDDSSNPEQVNLNADDQNKGPKDVETNQQAK